MIAMKRHLLSCAFAGLAAGVFLSVSDPCFASSARSFFAPRYEGQPLAFCLDGRKDCGKPAATIWCQSNGYDDALNYARKPVGVDEDLRFADTGDLCSPADCIGFRQIKCVRF